MYQKYTTKPVEKEPKDVEPTKVAIAQIAEVANISVPEGSTVVAESSIPVSCNLGNLIFEKKYEEAIALGLKLLEDIPKDSGVLINMMDAYFKGKVSPDYLEKSTYYAKQAMLYGHNTGYAQDRLAKNLDKAKKFHQSLQLYNLILDNKDFHFSTHGMGNGIDFVHRKESVIKKMDKAVDTEEDILFTPEEVAQIIQGVKDADATEEAERKAYEARMAKWEEYFANQAERFRKILHPDGK